MLARQLAALVVVGGDEADDVAALEPESKITTGTPLRTALMTGATSAPRRAAPARCRSPRRPRRSRPRRLCESRSSSRNGPRHVDVDVQFRGGLRAPACTLCQNTCEVPFGIIAMVTRIGREPPPPRQQQGGGRENRDARHE
jgi:hypothetical protein